MLGHLQLLLSYNPRVPMLLSLNHYSLNGFLLCELFLIVDHCLLIWRSLCHLAFCLFCLVLRCLPLKDNCSPFLCSLGALVFLILWLCLTVVMTLQFAPLCCFVNLFWGVLHLSWMHILTLFSLQSVLIDNISLIIILLFLIS